jgi:outer membrane receptor protein involved in Fe transport
MAAGRWIFKHGMEYRVYLSNYTDPEQSFQIRTQADFTRQFVDAVGNPVGSVTADIAGWSPASFLLGAGDIYVTPSRNAQPALAQKYLAFYSQSDWRTTDRFTLNLGLRWDLQPGPTERYDRISSFDFKGKNPYGTAGAIVFSGKAGTARNYWNTAYGDFGPRIGAATSSVGGASRESAPFRADFPSKSQAPATIR